MTTDVELACKCRQVHGWLRAASPGTVNRVLCYCDDCQAFLHHLDRADLLDANGGSDIVQVAPASLSYDRGADRIACVRLSPKGLYRWYASCCRTPLGNMVSPGIPFIGIAHEVFGADAQRREQLFGRAAPLLGKFAIGTPPAGSTTLGLPFVARTLRLILGWKVRGRAWPHPFFDREARAPIKPVSTLSTSERDALRPKCGPRAS